MRRTFAPILCSDPVQMTKFPGRFNDRLEVNTWLQTYLFVTTGSVRH